MNAIKVWWHSLTNVFNTRKSHRMVKVKFWSHNNNTDKPDQSYWRCECSYGEQP